MGLVWTCIEHVSFFLEPAEREAILGDLRERNVTSSDLADTIGLVLSRQLGAWFSPRPWLLSAAFLLPAICSSFSPLAPILFAHHWYRVPYNGGTVTMYPLEAVASAILSWSLGFTLGRLGGRRLGSLLSFGLLTFGVMAYRRVTSFASLMATFGEDSRTPNGVAIAAIFLCATIPLLHGYSQSLRDARISSATAWLIAIAFYLTSATQFHIELLSRIVMLLPLMSWPLLYLIAVSHRREKGLLSRAQ